MPVLLTRPDPVDGVSDPQFLISYRGTSIRLGLG